MSEMRFNMTLNIEKETDIVLDFDYEDVIKRVVG